VAERPELGEPLPGAEDYLKVEVVHGVRAEGARHLDDLLTRRTRISIETFDRGTRAAAPAAALMAPELGWDEAQTAAEVDRYLRRVEAERQSQRALTDREADEARAGGGQ
jgi:glycerol-3-phosphate dehydrogenase